MLQNTQHYSRLGKYLTQGLPELVEITNPLEPFVGEGDLLFLYNGIWEMYDIDPKIKGTIPMDTLKYPPDYSDRTVITNPPYLARNKCKESKWLYEFYQEDDLYKIFLKTIRGAKNGIVIIPMSFFTDDRSASIRKDFCKRFKILRVNVFNETVFDTTTYTVCSFAFEKGVTGNVPFYTFPDLVVSSIYLEDKYSYRLGGADLNLPSETVFGRLQNGKANKPFTTDMFLYAIDGKDSKIRMVINKDHFNGKSTDRTFCTITSDIPMPDKTQKLMVDEFNDRIDRLRKKYNNLIFTNFRDFGRKRISFDFAYSLLEDIRISLENSK